MAILPPSTILITGASSGIGAALAQAYAASGVKLGLLGRDEVRLLKVAENCRARGAEVETACVDVTSAEGMRDWLEAFDAKNPVDLVIANAGISGGSGGESEPEAQARKIMTVNVDGVLNTVLPLIPKFCQRRRGQIALMSSLAGMRGLPSAPAYSASKAAVRFLGEAWRGELKKYGVKVSVICPGYIRTPMTDVNTFPMPFLMEADEAARRIVKGLAVNRSRIVFPLRLYVPLWLLSCLSPTLTDPIFAAMPAKPIAERPPA